LESTCCADSNHHCFKKNEHWASCNASCSEKMKWVDDAWKEQDEHVWDCDKLTNEDDEGKENHAKVEVECAAAGESCLESTCCADSNHHCFKKNEHWASCNASCSEKMKWVDNAWKEQDEHVWDCDKLTNEGDDGKETLAKAGSEPCRKVFIDTDVGTDDNIALVAAFGQHKLGNLCIIGIGVTDGNIPAWIANTTFPRLLALFGMEELPFSIPAVPDGKDGEIDKLYADTDGTYDPPGGRGAAEHIHGKDGMGGLGEFMQVDSNLEFPNRDKDGKPATFLEQRLESECGDKECDLLVMGPLTNIVAADKDILAKHVRSTVWMGGSFVKPERMSSVDREGVDYATLNKGDWNVGLRRRGNIAPLSEFNAWAGSEPLAQFLTERDDSVGFDIIPLDVTSKLMWSPALVDKFEDAAKNTDEEAWDNKEFRDGLVKFRSEHPGTTKENNIALSDEILDAFDKEMATRHENGFFYPSTPGGRVSFIRDISVKGWAATVADGQIPKESVGNLAHDVSVVAYTLSGGLFDPGEVEDITVVMKGTAKEKFWDQLDEDGFLTKEFHNEQWGAAGAPIKNDLKGAVFESDGKGDAPLAEELGKDGVTEDLKEKSGKGRVVSFKNFEDEPNKAENEVMEWLVAALADATK